jgi:hypothetical protein
LAREETIGLDFNFNESIPDAGFARSRRPLAAQSQNLTVGDAGWDGYIERAAVGQC